MSATMRRRAHAAFLLAAVVGASCDRPSARPPGPGEPAALHRASGPARDTLPFAAGRAPHRLADDIRSACDDLQAAFAATALAAHRAPPPAGPRDTSMIFGGLDSGTVEHACVVSWADSAGALPWTGLLAAAKARGWVERDHLLSADGPDGSVLAISRGGVACVLEIRWDGGDDSDSTYVPAPGSSAAASCFPNRADRY